MVCSSPSAQEDAKRESNTVNRNRPFLLSARHRKRRRDVRPLGRGAPTRTHGASAFPAAYLANVGLPISPTAPGGPEFMALFRAKPRRHKPLDGLWEQAVPPDIISAGRRGP